MPTFLPLRDVPLSALDRSWENSLGTAPGDLAERVLCDADALRRSGNADDSWRALAAYRALIGRLAAMAPADVERVEWVSREDPSRDATTRTVADLAASHGTPDGKLDGERLIAECELRDDRIDDAERRLRRLLARTRGRGDRIEMEICHALSLTFSVARREIETLVTARHAFDVASRIPSVHPVYLANTGTALVDAYWSIGDVARSLAQLERLEAVAARLSEPDATRLRRSIHDRRFDVALSEGDVAAAERHLERAEAEKARDLKTPGFDPNALFWSRPRLLLERGRYEEVADWLARQAVTGDAQLPKSIGWAQVDLTVRLKTGRTEGLAPRVEAHLAQLEDGVRNGRVGTGTRLRYARNLGRSLLVEGAHPDLAARAFRAAADAAFDRIFEIERCVRDLPELSSAPPEDLAALAEYRARFVDGHREVLLSLRDLLAETARRHALPAWARGGDGHLVSVCAWCRSVRDADGRWLPLGHFFSSTTDLPVTHGICEPCAKTAFAAL